jgi:hypothetical protein
MADKIFNRVTAVGTPASAVETVIITGLPYVYDNPNPYVGLEHSGPGNGVKLSGIINITPGASTTAGVIRVRQGSLTGAVVGLSQTSALAAGVPQTLTYDEFDTSRYPAAGGVYVLTLSTTAATAVGTVNVATLTTDGA